MKRKDTSKRITYLPVVVTIAVLIIVNLVVILLSLLANEQNATVINVAGKQRMLSQKIKSSALFNFTNGTILFTSQNKEDLALWRQVHEELKEKDGKYSITTSFENTLERLDELDNFIDEAENFLKKETTPTQEQLNAFTKNQDEYLALMDEIVNALQLHSEIAHKNEMLSVMGISFFSLVLLFLLYRFLLKSTADQLESQADMLIAKNKQLEHFAYIASHDLQEPLRTVTNYLEIFEEDYAHKLDKDAAQYFRFINEATQRMRNLIQGLLTYSRLGNSGDRTMVDVNIVIDDIKKDFAKSIKEKNIIIKVDQMPIVNGFNVELRQLFQNLISNGIKFSKPSVNPVIEITFKENNFSYEFSVTDNGIGMESQNLNKIFDMFSRLHSSKVYQGQGIGLAFCKKIVELHQGQIWVESELDVGTTIYFNISK